MYKNIVAEKRGQYEKARLADQINGYFQKSLRRVAPIKEEKLQVIPRSLLRKLWKECREHKGQN